MNISLLQRNSKKKKKKRSFNFFLSFLVWKLDIFYTVYIDQTKDDHRLDFMFQNFKTNNWRIYQFGNRRYQNVIGCLVWWVLAAIVTFWPSQLKLYKFGKFQSIRVTSFGRFYLKQQNMLKWFTQDVLVFMMI